MSTESAAPTDAANDLGLEVFALGPFATNCHVLYETGDDATRCWVVDCGLDPEPMIAWIRERGLEPQSIVLTHCHLDHVGGIDAFCKAFGDLPIVCHPIEREWNADPMLNLSGGHGVPISVRPPTAFLSDGETLELGDASFDVWHVPGHSPGSIAFVSTGLGLVIAGDTLFAGSIGRFDFPTSDASDLKRSLDRLMTLPDEMRVYPGHGPDTTIGRERRSNPFIVNGF